ncbi:iron-binding protein [Methanothermobacter thermautotrophicus]|uniref:Iron-binding protein n=2 Tax=Methanothermobacter thermautotrophicus TaxID=145262 RepID=A0A842YNT7_METTF|nr:iron-binding protein [Methanothermobacter thermautotrophicus]
MLMTVLEMKRIKVLRNGPYLVEGSVPLYEEVIVTDEEGHTREFVERRQFPLRERYVLCRCGASGDKPYCDGTHSSIGFEGTETASLKPYIERARVFRAGDLELTDVPELCDHSRFCLRAGGIRELLRRGDRESIQTAIEEAMICPSGRLVLWDRKTGKPYERDYEKSIVVIHDKQKKCEGPLWVRGGIPIESADGREYEVRNRVTLCRCGLSDNKPFCDGSHWMTAEEKLEFKRKWGIE